MHYRSIIVLASLSIIGAASPAQAETLDEAVAKLVEAHARLKSYSASVKSKEDLDFGNDNTMKSTVKGKVDWLRKDDKILYRSDAESESIQRFNGIETPTRATTTMIFDGEFFYKIENVMGELHVGKLHPNPILGANAEIVLARLKDDHELKLLRVETWGNAPCYVIEATPKEPDKSEHMARALYYFRQDTGTAVRTIGFDAKGRVAYSIEHVDVERNPKIDPERFVFTMPEGANFTDFVNP